MVLKKAESSSTQHQNHLVTEESPGLLLRCFVLAASSNHLTVPCVALLRRELAKMGGLKPIVPTNE